MELNLTDMKETGIYWFTTSPPTKGQFVAIWTYYGEIWTKVYKFAEDGEILDYDPQDHIPNPWVETGIYDPMELVLEEAKQTLRFMYIPILDS